MRSKRGLLVSAAVAAALTVVAPAALAHVERASYWPDPGVQTVGGQPTGGKVPEIRPLFDALDKSLPGDTRVVCEGSVPKVPKFFKNKGEKLTKAQKKATKRYRRAVNKNPSIRRINKSMKQVVLRKNKAERGYWIRPSQPKVQVTKKYGKKLVKFNKKLLKRCKFDSIQKAVNASHNNDRIVILPGTYTEPDSRNAPTQDPKCANLKEVNDRGNTGALSYAYQVNCPNDQNLIAVIGRGLAGDPPQPPSFDRHNLPDEGPCIRCNLQMEGTGFSADDVVVDAGNVAAGDGGPANPVKDIVIRADRADGFVALNMNVRHAAEHGFYVVETDGYRLQKFKGYWNEEYAVLTFTSDHALIADCDTAGSGDAAIYPGASPDTGEQTREGSQRFNTEITRCDMHHSTLGYSGSNGNAVHVHHNNFYDNANGFSTDTFSAAGHPGFPQDSDLLEDNWIYSNNFNPYDVSSDVVPTVGVPVGTGMWIAGGNNNIVRNNFFYDNWRRGAMLFAIPDAFICDNPAEQIPGCDPDTPGSTHTSFRNRFYGNTMGIAPGGARMPNGVDFWWDQGGINPPGNQDDCWYDNTGKDGTAASITSIPEPPGLPSDCADSPGGGGAGAEQVGELLRCVGAPEEPGGACTWFDTPPRPPQ